MADDGGHEVRELRFKVKQLSTTDGRQGQTIHGLRGELAEMREINGKIARNEVPEMERQAEALLAKNADLRARQSVTATPQ
jgi:FtsZ-binding cell division protein ZapB